MAGTGRKSLMLAPAFVLIAASAEAQTIALDGIVITSTKTEEAAIDVLGGSSAIGRTQLDTEFQPDKVSEVLRTMPGVTTQETARDTATAVNIRGLQDFGRVNILIEGARQNFQRSGHTANGVFYIEPEMIKRVDVTRGPTATIYGSGAIGGVVAFDLLDADDILKPGETMAGRLRTRGSTNDEGKLASQTAAVRIGNFDIVGQLNGRWSNDYKDGDGNVVPGSNDTTKSGFLKARWRLAPGHTLTGTYIGFNSKFEDQVDSEGALRDTAVNNRQMTLGYTFTSPSNPLIDFNAKVYKNTTELEQIRKTSTSATQYDPSLFPFFPPAPYPPAACAHIPGSTPIFVGQGACSSTTTFPSGSQRSFNVDTVGFDVHNTSRLNWGSTGLALTYGGDLFRDRVNNFDPFEAGDELTPSGERQVSGAFIQAHLKMFDTVDVIGAMRYDSYQLESNTTQNSGERVSPKATIGYTPLPGFTFFTTYAEGYRAPAVTETLISGVHVPPANFSLLPNPDLRPEVAHNLEAGLNVKLDGVIMRGDSFRAKFVAFRNKIEDYIDTVFIEGAFGPPIFSDDRIQYQNINKAKLEGVEIEAAYDARQWFFGLAAHRIRGINEDTGAGLYNAPADQVTLTGGFRAFDEKLIAGARVKLVAAQDRFAETFSSSGLAVHEHSDGYALLDLFGQYQFNENAVMNLNIDNVFDKNYRQHLDQYNSPGLRARLGMTVRLGG